MLSTRTFKESLRVVDYQYLLPMSARFPRWAATPLNLMRVLVLLVLRSDWRACIGDSENFPRRLKSLKEIRLASVGLGPLGFYRLLYAWVLDEWISARLARSKMTIGFDIKQSLPQEQTIWITAHYAASIPGAAFMAASSRTTNAMGSRIIDLKSIPQIIRDFYKKKYQVLASCFNGGKVIYYEDGLRDIYRAIEKGDDLIIVADLPPSGGQAPVVYDFFGKKRGFAPAPVHLACKYKISLQSYLVRECKGRMVVELGPRSLISEPDDAREIYRFLLGSIERQPEQWWAADLLTLLPVQA